MPSSIEYLGLGLAQSLASLGRALQSKRGLENVLRVLGWSLPKGGALPSLGAIRFPALIKQLKTTQESIAAAQISAGGGAISVSLDLGLPQLFQRVRDVLADIDAAVNGFAALPANYLAQTQIQTEFVPRLLSWYIARMLAEERPVLYQTLVFLHIIDIQHLPEDVARFQVEHDRITLRLDRITALLGGPGNLLRDLVGWGLPNFSAGALFIGIAQLLQGLGARFQLRLLEPEEEQLVLGRPVPEANGNPLPQVQLNLLQGTFDSRFEVGLLLSALRASVAGGADGGIAIGPLLKGTTQTHFQIVGGWELALASTMDLAPGTALFQRPGQPPRLIANLHDASAAKPGDSFGISLKYAPTDAPRPLLVIPGGSRLEYSSFSATIGARSAGSGPQLFVEVEMRGGRFVLSLGGVSELLSSMIPKDLIRADFDLALGFAAGRAYLRGSEALEVTFPVDLSLGPVDIESVTLALTPAGGTLPIEISGTLKTTLGPLKLNVERIGFTAALSFPPAAKGNLGPLNIDLGFKVPSGIGLILDAGPVTGGGFLLLDPVARRYGGALQLKLSFITVTAFGLYESVGGGVSFVAVLGIRFNPGIQLSFGFALSGVGGIIGINRQTNVDLLRERLASGASGNVLFCDDPLHKASSLLGDLGMFFPAAPGGFLVGPTLQITWLAPLVRLDVGILLQFPGPSKIVLLGSLRALIGLDESLALLYVRMDFMGAIDTGARLISFDAQLVNSHVLGILHLTGETALRIGYGSPPYVVLSIGGFHPRFDPAPLHLPVIPRVGASLDASFLARVYLRLEMYLAFTSNTLQAGAHVQAGVELGPLSAEGHFDFDALLQFRPFWFEADFSAGMSVKAFGISFASVDIAGQVSGPGPVVIHAEGSVRRLGIKVSGSATIEIGDHNKDAPAAVPSIVKALEGELNLVSNLRADGEDPAIILAKDRPPSTGVVVLPRGTLVWEQKRAPLKTLIQRFEGVSLEGIGHELHVNTVAGWAASDEQDWFSTGSFATLDLAASQTMNNSTFQQLPSGLRIGSAADVESPNAAIYTPNMHLVKKPGFRLPGVFAAGAYMTSALTSAMRDRNATPAMAGGPPKVGVQPETFDVHESGGGQTHAAQTPFQAFQLSRLERGSIAVPSADVTVAL
jgi:hypothetical protein